MKKIVKLCKSLNDESGWEKNTTAYYNIANEIG